MLTRCDIFPPAATTACTRSAERKQSGYCVPLGWPAPILRAPTPPTMTTRGIDMHCCCVCASAILWSPTLPTSQVVPRPSLIYPWSLVWWPKMISCPISGFAGESSQLWSVNRQYTPASVCRGSELCLHWTPGGVGPAVFFVDVPVYVPMYILPTAVCVWLFSVVFFFLLHAPGSCLLLTYTIASLMHCSGLHSSFVKSCVLPARLLVSGREGSLGPSEHAQKGPADTHPSSGAAPVFWCTNKETDLTPPPPPLPLWETL